MIGIIVALAVIACVMLALFAYTWLTSGPPPWMREDASKSERIAGMQGRWHEGMRIENQGRPTPPPAPPPSRDPGMRMR